jgi:hypothetical protein
MEEDGQPKKVRLRSSLLLALKVNVECVIQSNILIRANTNDMTRTLGDA